MIEETAIAAEGSVAQPTPRSLVSLDHNGESQRLVVLGSNNAIVYGCGSYGSGCGSDCEMGSGEGKRGITLRMSYMPGFLLLSLVATLAFFTGVLFSDTIRNSLLSL